MAKLFYKDKPIIGLDISTTGVKVMAIDAKKLLVLGYGSVDLEPSKAKEALETNHDYLTGAIKDLLSDKVVGELPSDHAVIAIPTAQTYSRTFTVPASVEKSLADAVMTEADQYIPLPSDTLYIDYEVIERTKDQLTVLMSAVSKSIIDSIVNITTNAGLRPILIEPSISAVARVLATTEDGHLPTMIVDIGPTATDIAILEGGFIRVTGGVPIGGNTLTLAIAKKLNITLENAHQLKVLNGLSPGPRQQKITGALEPHLERIVAEVRKILRYHSERINNDHKVEQILVVGGGSNVPGIGDFFTNALIMPARVASPWQQLDFGKLAEPAKQFRPRYITVAGLASVEPKEARK